MIDTNSCPEFYEKKIFRVRKMCRFGSEKYSLQSLFTNTEQFI